MDLIVVTSVVEESEPIRSISKIEQNPTVFLYYCFGLPNNDDENKIELNY